MRVSLGILLPYFALTYGSNIKRILDAYLNDASKMCTLAHTNVLNFAISQCTDPLTPVNIEFFQFAFSVLKGHEKCHLVIPNNLINSFKYGINIALERGREYLENKSDRKLLKFKNDLQMLATIIKLRPKVVKWVPSLERVLADFVDEVDMLVKILLEESIEVENGALVIVNNFVNLRLAVNEKNNKSEGAVDFIKILDNNDLSNAWNVLVKNFDSPSFEDEELFAQLHEIQVALYLQCSSPGEMKEDCLRMKKNVTSYMEKKFIPGYINYLIHHSHQIDLFNHGIITSFSNTCRLFFSRDISDAVFEPFTLLKKRLQPSPLFEPFTLLKKRLRKGPFVETLRILMETMAHLVEKSLCNPQVPMTIFFPFVNAQIVVTSDLATIFGNIPRYLFGANRAVILDIIDKWPTPPTYLNYMIEQVIPNILLLVFQGELFESEDYNPVHWVDLVRNVRKEVPLHVWYGLVRQLILLDNDLSAIKEFNKLLDQLNLFNPHLHELIQILISSLYEQTHLQEIIYRLARGGGKESHQLLLIMFPLKRNIFSILQKHVMPIPQDTANRITLNGDHVEGTYDMEAVYNVIVKNPFSLLKNDCYISNGYGIDASGPLRNLLDQSIVFIREGVKPIVWKVREQLKRPSYNEEMNASPLLLSSDREISFFPFKSHRSMGTFVAAVVAKSLKMNLKPNIRFPDTFFKYVILSSRADGVDQVEKFHDEVYGNNWKDILLFLDEVEEIFREQGSKVIYLPNPSHFTQPFQPNVHFDIEEKASSSQYISFVIPETVEELRQALQEYRSEFIKQTYSEFLLLLQEFLRIFNRSYYLPYLKYVRLPMAAWHEVFRPSIPLTPQAVFSSLHFTSSSAILSLIYSPAPLKIYFVDAMKTIIACMEGEMLEDFVSSITGSSAITLTPRLLNVQINYRKEFVGVSHAFTSGKYTREMCTSFMEKVYQRQLTLLPPNVHDPAGLSMAPFPSHFVLSSTSTCVNQIRLSANQNCASLIVSIFSQLNIDRNNIYG